MRDELSAWWRRVWRQKWLLLALALYKLAEDRILSVINNAVDAVVGPNAGAFVGQLLSYLTWLGVPAAIIVILGLAYRDRHAADGPYQMIRSEWGSKDRTGHWDEVRKMAYEMRSDLQEAVTRAGETVRVKELQNLRARVDSLEMNVAGYEDIWEQGGGSFWDTSARERWEHRNRAANPQPTWSVPLWVRTEYVISWLWAHAPYPRPPGSMPDWGFWESDMWSYGS